MIPWRIAARYVRSPCRHLCSLQKLERNAKGLSRPLIFPSISVERLAPLFRSRFSTSASNTDIEFRLQQHAFSQTVGSEEDDFGDHEENTVDVSSSESVLEDDVKENVTGVCNSTPLYEISCECNYGDLMKSLEQWLANGHVITRQEVEKAFEHLSRRKLYRRALKISQWLETKPLYTFTKGDYADRVNFIAKVHGMTAAEKYFSNLPSEMKGVEAYRMLLSNCTTGNDIQKAESIFEMMKAQGFQLTAIDYNQLLTIYLRHGRSGIRDVLLRMEDSGVKPTVITYNILIDAKGRMHNFAGMERVLEEMKIQGVQPSSMTFALLARHYVQAGNTAMATEALNKLKLKGLSEYRNVLKVIIQVLAELGEKEEVERIWQSMQSFPGISLQEYSKAVWSFGKLGEIEKAEVVFQKMLQSGRRMTEEHYNSLLKVYVDNGRAEKGKEFLKEMFKNGYSMNSETLHILVSLKLNVGKVNDADAILFKAYELKQLKPRYSTLRLILDKYAEVGDVGNAERILRSFSEFGYSCSVLLYETLLQAYVNSGTPAYGFAERLEANGKFPSRRIRDLLRQQFTRTTTRSTPRKFCLNDNIES